MRQRSVSVIVSVGVVVSVLTGVVGSASASVGSGDRPVFVPVVPCRLLDTRPSSAVGVRTSPLGPGDTWVQPVSGVNGNCTLPSSIAAVVLNVTALNGSAASFLTVFPDGVERPRTSNVNWLAGGAPRPNQVGVAVSTTGRISLYNEAGTVDVIADVVGYYQAHSHGDRFAPRAELDAALPAQGVVRVGASEFVPAASDAVLGRDDTCVNLASTGASESYLLHASVPLPVGAHVTG